MKVLETPTQKVIQTYAVKKEPQVRVLSQEPQHQEASVIKAMENDTTAPSGQTKQKEGSLWPWYIGASLLGALALLGLRLTKTTEQKPPTPADDYEIIEETDDKEPH